MVAISAFKPWVANMIFEKGEIFRYGDAVYEVLEEHNTGTKFNSTSAYYKVIDVGKKGITQAGFVGTNSARIIQGGIFTEWAIIKNTHDTQILYLTYSATATTANGYPLAPGEKLELPFGAINDLNGIGSGASTTFVVIGC